MAYVAPFCWQRFTQLATSNPSVLKNVVNRLDKDVPNLRAIDKGLRCAINRTVSVVCYAMDNAQPHPDLAEVFPDADQLICELQGSEPFSGPPVQHLGLFLDCVASGSPRFVRKLRVLTFRIRESHVSNFAGVLADFLPRCTSIQELEVRALPCHIFRFQGQGSTPAEQRASMQAQVAAMCASSEFLAPASWPSCRCLSALHLAFDPALAAAVLPAALQTPSLASIGLVVDPAYPAAALAALPGLSRLASLTQLHLDTCNQGPDEQQQLLSAACRAASLRCLTIAGSTREPGEVVRLPLAQLPHLTALEVDGWLGDGLHLDLQLLAGAPALQHLTMADCTGVGSLASLFPLTALTRLHGPVALELAEEDEGPPAAEAPEGWRRGLRDLRWPAASWGDHTLAVVPQLRSLTRLCMMAVGVSPEFCRMLAKLPHLAELTLEGAWVSGSQLTPPPIYVRPILAALRIGRVPPSAGSMAALHFLARWTRVADAGIDLDALDVASMPVAVKGWSVGWLRSAVRAAATLESKPRARGAGGYGGGAAPGYSLVDDDAAEALAAALQGPGAPAGDGALTLFLGISVRPSRLQLLPVPGCLRLRQLPLGAMEQHMPAWSDARILAALVRPKLERLTVERADLVDDAAVCALVRGAGAGLRELRLEYAAKLTDTALWKLCAGCLQLRRLELFGVAEVTAAGLLPLVAVHDTLQVLTVQLSLVQASSVAGLLGSVYRLYPGIDDKWYVEYTSSSSLSFERL